MEVKADYRAIFCEEAADQLREWEESLLALDRSAGDREPLNSMFRAIHTLKGSAGFIGFDQLQKVAHDLESSLSDVRDGTRTWDAALGELLFRGHDLCSSMIDSFTNGTPSPAGVEEFLATLAGLAGAAGNAGTANGTADPATAPAIPGPAAAAPLPAVPDAHPVVLEVSIEGQPREAYLRSFLVKARLDRLGTVTELDPAPEALRDGPGPFVYAVTMLSAQSPEAVAAAVAVDQVSIVPKKVAPAQPAAGQSAAEPAGGAVRDAHEQFAQGGRADEVVRVSVQKLDTLLNLVGELVIYNSGFVTLTQLMKEQYGKTRFLYDLEEKTESLTAITRELQDGIMKARMLPIASVFNRFRRVVRDLAKASGKAVNLEVFGEETEIDKKVIDRIGEPLVHLVRNAVDHGLEPQEARAAAGKPQAGTIRLGAYQDGDHICIEVSDDGKGLDRDAILAKAVEKGLIGTEEVQGAGTERVLGFIFLPGFSTARVVSDISGRGVGMDAVKRAVDEMNGNVRVRSTRGAGTAITISLPLTMAIITAVLVAAGESMYAIPLSAVREIVKTNDAILRSVGTRRVVLLRGEVLSLVSLAEALHADGKEAKKSEPGRPVVIVDFEGQKIGLEVEAIHGTREVVIKSLSKHYREVEGLIGASILGNGKIALIVDVEALIRIYAHAGNGKKAAGVIDAASLRDARPLSDDRPLSNARPDTPGAQRAAAPAAPPAPGPAAAKAAPALTAAAPAAAPAPAPAEREAAEAVKRLEELAKTVTGSRGRLLEEVNNQGAIEASISLSQLTGQDIRVSFPESRLMAIRDVAEFMGGEEITVGGMFVGVEGDLDAGILLVLPEQNLMVMDDLLHGRRPGTTREVAAVDLSGISEMGNILSSCFINAMANETNLHVSPMVPELTIDMCLPVIDSVLARFNQSGDRILLTQTVIYAEGIENVVCHQVLFFGPGSLEHLMDALNKPAPAPQTT